MKKYYILVVFMALSLLFASCAVVEPENCALCTANIHSAGLINLQTGEIFIIELTGREGTMTLINTAGLTGWMSEVLRIELSEGRGINNALFCETCRKELKNAGNYSHALFGAGHQIMPLTGAVNYTLSGFAVEASENILIITKA